MALPSGLRAKVEHLLARNSWFSSLPSGLQEEILARSVVKNCARGKVINTEGSKSPGLMLLLEGQVAVTHWVGNEEEILIHVGEPGLWFGEVALLTDGEAIVNFVAKSDVRILLLPAFEFERMVARDPKSYRHFARLALERYVLLYRLIAEDRSLAPELRVRARLSDMVDARIVDRPEEGAVELTLSQADLAALLGLSRQTVNEVLQRLARQGLVELGFRKIVVPRPDELRSDLQLPPHELNAG